MMINFNQGNNGSIIVLQLQNVNSVLIYLAAGRKIREWLRFMWLAK